MALVSLGLLGKLAKLWTEIIFWAQGGHRFTFMEVSTSENHTSVSHPLCAAYNHKDRLEWSNTTCKYVTAKELYSHSVKRTLGATTCFGSFLLRHHI